MYIFDYGALIGFRIATAHPEWIEGIVSQNGNIYQEGLEKSGLEEKISGNIQLLKKENNIG